MKPKNEFSVLLRRVISAILFLLFAVLGVCASSDHLKDGLHGTKLRCCVMNESPISFLGSETDINGGLGGVIALYLSELQSFLGWQCSSVTLFSVAGSTGFNEFIDMMERCTENGTVKDIPECVCDIGIGGWFQNLFFVKAFDKTVWMCIAGLILFVTIVKYYDRDFAPAQPYTSMDESETRLRRVMHFFRNHPIPFRIRRALQSTWGRMTLIGDEEDAQNVSPTRQRLLNLVIGLAGLLLLMAYEASMTASLVEEFINTEYDSPEDLQLCRIQPEEICIPSGGALQLFWKNVIAKDKCHQTNSPQFQPSFGDMLSQLASGNCKYGLLLESAELEAVSRRYCGEMLIIGDPLYTGGLSMVLPKGSNLTYHMSHRTKTIEDRATSPSLLKYFQKKKSCKAESGSKITIRKLGLFFAVVFAAILTIALLICFLPREPLRIGSRRRRDRCRDSNNDIGPNTV